MINQESYEKGFKECQAMCIKIIKESSKDGEFDIIEPVNYLIDKIEELL